MTLHQHINSHDDIAWTGRAADAPIVDGGAPNPLGADPSDGFEAKPTTLVPSKADIAAHLYALFSPAFVQAYPDAWIEIAFGHAATGGAVDKAENFSVFDLQTAIEFAVRKNAAGCNVYVGPALRQGDRPEGGRSSDDDVTTSAFAWAEFDGAGDDVRIAGALKEKNIAPAIIIITGHTPNLRAHLYFKLAGPVSPARLRDANTALVGLLGGDSVQAPAHVMRLAGTINWPTPKKKGRGYIPELVTLHANPSARAYTADELIGLTGGDGSPWDEFMDSARKAAKTDDEVIALLKASQVKEWHNNMRDAVAVMIGRGMSDSAINIACAAYCDGGTQDADLKKLIDTGRKKFNKPSVEPPVEGSTAKESDIDRLNKTHAILPIGGKTRVVTFGELEEFPGRETIVMTQSIGDFAALQNKYRHKMLDKKGEPVSVPLGTHWIQSTDRRQYDGGMAFMPQRDGDVGNKLNLWRGFGVKPVKPAPGSRGFAGLLKFLDFMRDIICSGNVEHFQYLVKREATIFQKRIRSEIAIGLRTKEEGCGKGFYEFTMGHLLGTHSMQVTNPKHIVGNFNPHLETLLRLTADEALFVGSHEHRNALFSLITEPKLTIEPKGCGVYTADSFLNLSITSNADHFLPVSGTARRFFIPTVSTARMQDTVYFNDLKTDLEAGGYEALLHYFLHEVDLKDFNVRAVPNTAGLREQRDQSLKPLESWWVELLETGTLMGSDPVNPSCAVTHSYTREIRIETPGRFGGTDTQIRHVNQQGLYEQAKQIEPRLRNHFSDRDLGLHLAQMGCDNRRKVMRKRGWSFPPLLKCRAAWEKLYPGWTWRDADITEWRAEESDEEADAAEAAKAASAREAWGLGGKKAEAEAEVISDDLLDQLAAEMRSRQIGRAT